MHSMLSVDNLSWNTVTLNSVSFLLNTEKDLSPDQLVTIKLRNMAQRGWINQELPIKSVNHYIYLGVVLDTELSDGKDIQRRLGYQYCAASKLWASFSWCSNAVKNVPFRSFCTLMYASQSCRNFRKSCMQRLRVAYDFGCRALYNLPWRASVSSLQVQREACATRLCSHTFSVGLVLEPREGWIVTSSMLTPR